MNKNIKIFVDEKKAINFIMFIENNFDFLKINYLETDKNQILKIANYLYSTIYTIFYDKLDKTSK